MEKDKSFMKRVVMEFEREREREEGKTKGFCEM